MPSCIIHSTLVCGQQLSRSVRAHQHSSEDQRAALRNERRFREAKHFYKELQTPPRVLEMLQELHKASGEGSSEGKSAQPNEYC